MNRIHLILASITICVTGCYGPQSYTGEEPVPANAVTKDWRTIEVIHLNQIKRDYEIIGECRADAILHNAIHLKKQAARLNADAISTPEKTGGGYITSQAIRYK